MTFCGKCGTQLSDGAKFCPKCGNPVGSTQMISSKKDGKQHWFASFSLLLFTIAFMVAVAAFISNYSTISKYFSSSSEAFVDVGDNEQGEIAEADTSGNDSDFGNSYSYSEEKDYDWLQGHWVYEQGNYKGHFIIQGNSITQYSSMNPERYEATYRIDGDELRAKLIDGMDLTVKIDFANKRLDYGDGNWMHKTSSSDSDYSSSSSSSSLTTEFQGADNVVGYLANHTFTDGSGLDIRFDSNGGIYIDNDYAGVVSVLTYNSTSALLRYRGGVYGEGKIAVTMDGNGRMRLTDPVDGTVWYQK